MDVIILSIQFNFLFRQAKGAFFGSLHYNKDRRGPGLLLSLNSYKQQKQSWNFSGKYGNIIEGRFGESDWQGNMEMKMKFRDQKGSWFTICDNFPTCKKGDWSFVSLVHVFADTTLDLAESFQWGEEHLLNQPW